MSKKKIATKLKKRLRNTEKKLLKAQKHVNKHIVPRYKALYKKIMK